MKRKEETLRQKDIQLDRQTDTDTHTQREREREREREVEDGIEENQF